MHVNEVPLKEGREALPETYHELIEFGILASRKDPFDPMEKALKQVGDDYLARTEHLHQDCEILQEYLLSGELLAMSCVWRSPENRLVIATKGAPQARKNSIREDESDENIITF
ncbi:MAG: hypothetical protein V7K27_26455 [Nostoc sp.]|uniref:hypothetical protein n=1 Tax=Nostoc sp. TaxID=1180 RepID=UPI002FF6CA31